MSGDNIKKIKLKMEGHPRFYREVWLACCSIPRGQTRSYQWIAGKIGRPNAARAVANALAKNPFVPDVPCHRVIRKDGSPGGYSGKGGIKAKLRLLKKEAVF